MQEKPQQRPSRVPSVDQRRGESVDYKALLQRRWRVILSGVACGLILGLSYYAIASTKYKSESQVLVMKKDSNLPSHGVESAKDQVSEDLLATHMQIIQSPQIVRAALTTAGLEGLPSIAARLKADQDEVEYIIDHLKVVRGGTGQARLANVLTVSFQHVSDVDCQLVLQAVIESYRAFLADKFQDVSKEAVVLIREAKDELETDLSDAEAAYQEFRETAPLLFSGDMSSNTHRINFERLQQSISDLQVQYATTKTRLDVVEQGLHQVDPPLDEMDLLALLDDAHIARLGLLVTVKRGAADTEEFQITVPTRTANAQAEYEGLLALSLKEKSLLLDYGPDHALVQDVRQQIAATQAFLEKKASQIKSEESHVRLDPPSLLAGYQKLLNNDLATIKLRMDEMEQLAAAEEEGAKALVSAELRGETLRKLVARKQEMYDTVRDRLREINLVKDYGGLVTEVIAPAQLGEIVWPKLTWVILIGVAGGLVLGGGAVVAAERIDGSFRNAEEVRELLGLPILARMPKLPRIPAEELRGELHAVDATVVAFHRPKSVEAEAFRALRTSLFFNSRGSKQQVLLCVSANPGDGKTLLAANLAVSIAQTGRRTLLIESDLRRPRVHQMFAVNTDTGFASVLNGEIEPPEAVQETAVANLWAIPCGALPPNPSELLASQEFEEALQYYRDHFDFVVIDSSPLLAVADPSIIAPLMDAIVLTVRVAKDDRCAVLRAKELLERVDGRILGVAVNEVDAIGNDRSSYGYGYGYGNNAYFDPEEPTNAAATRNGHGHNGAQLIPESCNGDGRSPDSIGHSRNGH